MSSSKLGHKLWIVLKVEEVPMIEEVVIGLKFCYPVTWTSLPKWPKCYAQNLWSHTRNHKDLMTKQGMRIFLPSMCHFSTNHIISLFVVLIIWVKMIFVVWDVHTKLLKMFIKNKIRHDVLQNPEGSPSTGCVSRWLPLHIQPRSKWRGRVHATQTTQVYLISYTCHDVRNYW